MARILARNRLSIANHPGLLRLKRALVWVWTRIITWLGKASPLFYLCAAAMIASFVLGGGTRAGFLSDAILQLLALPLLVLALWSMFEIPLTKPMRRVLWFCLAIAFLPLVQLIPLPPWLWMVLPNRQPSAEAFAILGQGVPWMPMSVSPQATWLSALSLIPALAIFLGVVLLGYHERRLLSLVILAMGFIGVFVGLLQVAQGPESPLRFFAITNPTEAVGFFANRNHFAAFLYCSILFAIPWVLDSATNAIPKRDQRKIEYDVASILASIVGFTLLASFFAGEAMARSRAGLGLTMLAVLGAIALSMSVRRSQNGLTPSKLLVGAFGLAIAFGLQFAIFRIMERFTDDPIQNARWVLSRTTIDAALAYMPFGSGLGSFVPVYGMFERPEDVSNAYVNHAHNDTLEVFLETGVLGIALMGLFLFWLVRRSLKIWRQSIPLQGAADFDLCLARSATIVPGLLVLHSLVDYPLRTAGMMAIMAFACALLIEPFARADRSEKLKLQTVSERARPRAGQHREPVRASPKRQLPRSAPHQPLEASKANSPLVGQKWGAGVVWPKEWSSSGNSSNPEDDQG